jgi:hypothetical protein
MATFRSVTIGNDTGAALASAVINQGKDYGVYAVTRVFTAADIGAAAGQTRDATDPSQGCLICQVEGANIQFAISSPTNRIVDVVNSDYTTNLFATDAHYYQTGWRIVNSTVNGVKLSSLYLIDQGDEVSTQIVADDIHYALVVVGN